MGARGRGGEDEDTSSDSIYFVQIPLYLLALLILLCSFTTHTAAHVYGLSRLEDPRAELANTENSKSLEQE